MENMQKPITENTLYKDEKLRPNKYQGIVTKNIPNILSGTKIIRSHTEEKSIKDIRV